MFKKLLIANRGEIAVRVIKTARKLGIRTVAVYSEADTNSKHVLEADEAVFIGSSPSSQSYLNIDNILDAVAKTGADCVFPGYGFLSENAEFANRLEKAGVAFIGPPVDSIKQMGDKISAKKIAEKAKVSTIPGFTGEVKTAKQALKIATKIGFPVMMKAAAGGGGKGMRIVHNKDEVESAYQSTTNEAVKSFKDGRIFIEKFIEHPRHIEIQLMADKHGNIICLGERECSIQRHHQKVIEEAPSIFVDDKMRKRMYEQSASLAKAVGYFSAGTIEYIVDRKKNFYFLEMNTRLQVEHPVTEFITGFDLVEMMIKIAYDEKLPISQKEVKLKGHALECRIYAEDPSRNFLPSVGRITEYQEPRHNLPAKKGQAVRVDSGIYAGGEVSMFYDAMVAKLITYSQERQETIELMKVALGEYMIGGISNNISFLQAILENNRFQIGNLSTNFIAEEYPEGFTGADIDDEKARVFITTALIAFLKEAEKDASITGQLPGRNPMLGGRLVATIIDSSFCDVASGENQGKRSYSVNISLKKDVYTISYDNEKFTSQINWSLGQSLFRAVIAGREVSAIIERSNTGYQISHSGSKVQVNVRTPRTAELENYMINSTGDSADNKLIAPISGVISDVKVNEGDIVENGQELLVLEAMKMENMLYAEENLQVKKICISAGQAVNVNDVLIEFAEINKE